MRLPTFRMPGRDRTPAEPTAAPERQPKPAGQPTGKGRPTPKRQRAVPPPPPPTTRKEAYARMRARSRDGRGEARKGMLEGDERYVLARDRGPARKLVRDIVDARRNAGSYVFGAAVVILLAASVPGVPPGVKLAISYLWLLMILTFAADSYVLSRVIRRAVIDRFPDDESPARGHVFYGVMRAATFRRLRSPRPGVKIGTEV